MAKNSHKTPQFNYEKFRQSPGYSGGNLVVTREGEVAAAGTIHAEGFEKLVRYVAPGIDWIHKDFRV